MKSLGIFGALLVALLLPSTVFAAETIDRFQATATLTTERRITVTERIGYDFGSTPRHGLIREIPESYVRKGAMYDYRFKILGVRLDGGSVRYDISRSGGKVILKIGDPNATIQGRHVYEITYQTDRAINFFEEGSELYWNVTGNGWEVPIAAADFTLQLPHPVPVASQRTQCFTGRFGSNASECAVTADETSIALASTRLLNPEEGLTVVIGLPPGMVREPTLNEKIRQILSDNGILALPLLVAILMGWLWWRRGRDPKLGTIIPQYEAPEKLAPAEVAAIQEDGALSPRGLTATILDLARRGYVHVRYGEEKGIFSKQQALTLVKMKESDGQLSAVETILFDGLFSQGAEVRVKDLQKQKFHTHVHAAKEALWKTLAGKRIFEARPATVRALYFVGGVLMAGIVVLLNRDLPIAWLAGLLTGLIIVGFGWFMPRRTPRGAKLMAEIKGFEWFLSVTEKERLAFHNAPERTPTQFQALLPFAIALGVEEAWAKQFEGIEMQPPEWAEGHVPPHWASLGYVAALHSLQDQGVSSAFHPPSSAGAGGSGFSGGGSGGGGGGGGGGSW